MLGQARLDVPGVLHHIMKWRQGVFSAFGQSVS